MVDEQKEQSSSLMSEIDELQKKIDSVRTSRKTTYKNEKPLPGFISQLFVGIVFLLITILFLYEGSELLAIASILPFIITLLSTIYACADIFSKAREAYWHITGSVLVLMTSGLIMLLWMRLLSTHTTIILMLFAFILVIETLWFLLHAYLGFLRGKLGRESSITSILLVACWILLLTFWLYQNVLVFILCTTALIIFAKASFDFSKRFIEE